MSRSLAHCLRALPANFPRTKATVSVFSSQASSRHFSQSSTRCDESNGETPRKGRALPNTYSFLEDLLGTGLSSQNRAKEAANAMSDLTNAGVFDAVNNRSTNIDLSALSGQPFVPRSTLDALEPFHLHVYSHKHNTHITCTKPNREPIISMSCGNIGFRKSRRGTFDSAYSLTKYALERLIHTGWTQKMNRLELVMRGFGQGREAAVKVLMSPEGKILRDKIIRVADSTRIKFGGSRSEKPRRL
ncbi:hypothetical protein E4U55_006527 [Claviceps digitariae]|nr:hypothetical protein E4U55_006527 [Claviceps digitariae]